MTMEETAVFEKLERWVVGEFCRVMGRRACAGRTRALRELRLRAGQLLRDRAAAEEGRLMVKGPASRRLND